MLPSVGPQRMADQNLSARLDALAELVRIGRTRQAQNGQAQNGQAQGQDDGPGFSKTVLDDAESVLKRAGERLRLSGNHTVVALAGGTGSGKSTLFNALSGATFSPPGVTRPTTRHVHACVWGMQGAAPLLDWLGVQRRHRYARASVLDSGESDLDGLILLDLPDHDSVVTASQSAVDRLAKLADMVIWVLDPQKYADAAVHNRYLIPLSGHADVFTVVLNQIDVLPPQQARDCEEDLRRLLDAEELHDTPLLPVSARTGEGLGELRALLTETVTHNRAVGIRITADVDGVVGGFAAYGGPQVAPDQPATGRGALAGPAPLGAPLPEGDTEQQGASLPPWELGGGGQGGDMGVPVVSKPPWEDATQDGPARDASDPSASIPREPAEQLTAALAGAAGVTAVAQAMASAREAQAARLTGWPAGRLLRFRRDPLRAAGTAAAARQAIDAAVGLAQQSEVDNAITAFADTVGGRLTEPWASGLREAARCNAGMIPQALADGVRGAAAGWSGPPGWWRLVTAWQWLLTVLAVAGTALAVAIAVVRLTGHHKGWISEGSLVPWLLLMAVAMLVLGYVTVVSCRNLSVAAAGRERESAERAMLARIAGVTRDLVLTAAGREIAQYERFRRELAVAAGQRGA
jgi:GTP-binding protein EngB required for normal cell division